MVRAAWVALGSTKWAGTWAGYCKPRPEPFSLTGSATDSACPIQVCPSSLLFSSTHMMSHHCWEPVHSHEERQGSSEWYGGFSTLKPLLQEHLSFTDSILCLCGPQASMDVEEMFESGYRGITAVHSSSELIASWRQKHASSNRPALNCQAADIAEGLAFDHHPYHAIVDKGTIDGLLCKPTGSGEAEAAIRNIHTNLKCPGSFILFTHGPPSIRLPLLHKVAWESVSVKVIVPAAGARGSVAAAGGPSKGKAAAASEGLKVLKLDAAGVYPECASYVYVCKKPYV